MSSTTHRVLISALTLASISPLVSGCASDRLMLTPPSACSSLVGPSLRADVGPVDMPALTATAGDLWTAFDGQTGRLDVSNNGKRAVLEIIEGCEKRDAATVKTLGRPWWAFWR